MKTETRKVYEFFDGDIVVSTTVPGWVAIRHNGSWKHTDSFHSSVISDSVVENRMEDGLYEYVANRHGSDTGETSIW